MRDLSQQFISDSRAFLTLDYMPKIERCLTQLTEEQVWSRANGASNSIGNLLLHLAGSSRMWAIEVIGGKSIGRNRQAEFDRREAISPEQLMASLRAAMKEVDAALAEIPGDALVEVRSRGEEEMTVLWCVYHIVEHFSMHTGQILSMTKAMVGELAPAAESR